MLIASWNLHWYQWWDGDDDNDTDTDGDDVMSEYDDDDDDEYDDVNSDHGDEYYDDDHASIYARCTMWNASSNPFLLFWMAESDFFMKHVVLPIVMMRMTIKWTWLGNNSSERQKWSLLVMSLILINTESSGAFNTSKNN